MILGFDLEITRVILVAVLGGLLGILMMIPLRRALIVAEHGVLKYPEGTACAEVLKAAVSKESIAVADKTHTTANAEIVNQEAASGGGKVIFTGFGIGVLYQTAMGAFRMWKDTPERIFGAPFKGGSISATIEPALLGVGYIIGPRIASIMAPILYPAAVSLGVNPVHLGILIDANMLIDRIGRKPLLLIGSVGMTLTLGAMAAVFATADIGSDGRPMLNHMAAVVGLTAANLYIVAFAVSWGPVMWVLLGEMFPNEIRGAALAISGATNWVANFTVTVTFLPLLKAIGLTGAYVFYAIAAAISLPFVWFTLAETKDKTLEQMTDTTKLEPRTVQ